MRSFVPTLAAVAMIAVALPAIAQTPPASWKPLQVRQDEAAERIADGVESGALSDLQARELRNQFKGLLDLEDQYRKTGLTPAQQADLQARYDTLDARIEVNSHPASVQVERAPAPASP